MKEATINDVKMLWNLEIGYWYFSKEYREEEWRRFKKQMKKDGWTVQQAYEFLSKATGRI